MKPALLREILNPLIESSGVSNSTHATLPDFLKQLGLPILPAQEGQSKAQRIRASFEALPDEGLPAVAATFAEKWCGAKYRNQIQDVLWEGIGPQVSARFRREVARALPLPLFLDSKAFMQLLERLWILDAAPFDTVFGGISASLQSRIERHMIRNPDDWDAEQLFSELGAFTCTDRRFALFLEGLSSGEVLPDVEAQQKFVEAANAVLRKGGVELRNVGERDGYPVFRLVSLSSAASRPPKNLIFASAVKPDLRLSSAIDNDVEILQHADKVLVYDRFIGEEGLTWNHLQTWWAETQCVADAETAKRQLFARLLQCLPPASPPQRYFFHAYFRLFKSKIPGLPALLPEVWLHWDPKTITQRGAEALTRFRMDFLLLLPNRIRIVLEIDGQQHYSDEAGRAAPALYARTAAADRELKLAGYEVFHFGGHELPDQARADQIAQDFFPGLFERYGQSF